MMGLLTWSQCPSLSCVTRTPFGFASSVLRKRKGGGVRESERKREILISFHEYLYHTANFEITFPRR